MRLRISIQHSASKPHASLLLPLTPHTVARNSHLTMQHWPLLELKTQWLCIQWLEFPCPPPGLTSSVLCHWPDLLDPNVATYSYYRIEWFPTHHSNSSWDSRYLPFTLSLLLTGPYPRTIVLACADLCAL